MGGDGTSRTGAAVNLEQTVTSDDPFTPEKRSEVMSSVGSADTEPEMILRRWLWSKGLRYRVHDKVAGVQPDLVFRGPEVAVFVDGCFWHGCPKHYTAPKNNAEYWQEKLRRNRKRDRSDTRRLNEAGWTVLRFWECEIREEVEEVGAEVISEVR